MNQISQARQSTSRLSEIPPASLSRESDRDISICLNGIENGIVRAEAALPQRRRDELENRLDVLDGWLAPSDFRSCELELLTMISAFPRRSDDDDAAAVKVVGYRIAVEDYPKWVTSRSAKSFIKGLAGSSRWCPSPAEFGKACLELVRPYQVERERIKRALDAKVEESPPSDRSKVLDGFDALKRELAGPGGRLTPAASHNNIPPGVAKAMAEAELQAMLHAGPEKIELSDGLRAKFRQQQGAA